ncbi:hypothetical protein [Nonomuraea cavernae]|uniref:hypothetical protein n=1 Tax=Nonomuraea cavernae TaxID=2045107 RepID=UPI001666E08E|nr:hypothetical protein [Nonomuraea cavernae]MCA2188660.1 hypothetical protein [Nonomuraea cavernae]
MKRVLGCSLVAVAGLLVVAGLAAGPLISELWEHRRVCSKNYDSVEAALASFDVLDAAPTGAAPTGERDRGCTDTDDHHATISRSYRLPGQHGSPKDVESFYQDLALRNDWTLLPTEGSADEPRCMVKEVEGAEVSLNLWFDPESEDTFEVSASTWPC